MSVDFSALDEARQRGGARRLWQLVAVWDRIGPMEPIIEACKKEIDRTLIRENRRTGPSHQVRAVRVS